MHTHPSPPCQRGKGRTCTHTPLRLARRGRAAHAPLSALPEGEGPHMPYVMSVHRRMASRAPHPDPASICCALRAARVHAHASTCTPAIAGPSPGRAVCSRDGDRGQEAARWHGSRCALLRAHGRRALGNCRTVGRGPLLRRLHPCAGCGARLPHGVDPPRRPAPRGTANRFLAALAARHPRAHRRTLRVLPLSRTALRSSRRTPLPSASRCVQPQSHSQR